MLRPNRSMIKLKSPREIGLMREAGKVVAEALARVRELAVPGAHHRRDERGGRSRSSAATTPPRCS